MSEYSVEMVYTVREALEKRLNDYPDKAMWAYKIPGDPEWIYKSSIEFNRNVENAGAWFIKNGIYNKKIVILGESSFSWALLFYSVTCSGNIAVPIDYYLNSDTIRELISFNDCDMVFYSDDCKDRIDCIREYFSIPFMNINDIQEISETDAENEYIEAFRNMTVEPSDTAAIFFTSGSTGKRKGVELSHKNIVVNAVWADRYIKATERCYHVVPFHHSAGIPALFFQLLGCCTYISSGISYLPQEFMEIKPTLICVVPVMLPKFYDLYRLLGAKVCAQLICGAAPNDGEWIEKLKSINVHLYFGYGMTECSPGIAMSSELYDHSDNSMGIFGCCEVKIDSPNSDGIGEILVKGSNVMKGYYKMPEETAEVLRDGWLYTGDLGILDKDNFLTVVGRKKNIIVLSNGENIAPEPLEDKLMKICGAAECIVCSRDGVLAAEIYAPNADEEEIKQKVKELNHVIPPYSRIVRVIMRKEPFPKNALGKIMRNDIN